jgi:hypothetical protein
VPDYADERAKTLDGAIKSSLASLRLPSSRDLIAQLRTYLLKMEAEIHKGNNVYRILRKVESRQRVVITLGPTFDDGQTDQHFHLESGARLSFGLTLREANGRCALVAYRFQLNFPEGHAPSFYRFDLNDKGHAKPLLEPRCHIHPGLENVRLPLPALTPVEVLDRIFLVIEPELVTTLR